MSRIGRLPVALTKGVKVGVVDGTISVEGPRGKLERKCPQEVTLQVDSERVNVVRSDDTKRARSMHGLVRSLVANMVTGVTKGFERKLQIVGVGYRAEVSGKKLVMTLGYAKPVEFSIPEGIQVGVEANTRITVSGADKERVGQVSADIRECRPPENYKGKGIRYDDERVKLKPGKTGVA
jgi:large subunit ribosomal protein L6